MRKSIIATLALFQKMRKSIIAKLALFQKTYKSIDAKLALVHNASIISVNIPGRILVLHCISLNWLKYARVSVNVTSIRQVPLKREFPGWLRNSEQDTLCFP
jgi:hypothetical protein